MEQLQHLESVCRFCLVNRTKGVGIKSFAINETIQSRYEIFTKEKVSNESRNQRGDEKTPKSSGTPNVWYSMLCFKTLSHNLSSRSHHQDPS